MAAGNRLLSVAHRHGKLRIYRLEKEGPQLVSSIDLGTKPNKMCMVGNQLFILQQDGRTAVMDLSDFANPQVVGSYASGASSLVRTRFTGDTAVSYHKHGLRTYSVVRKP